MDAGLGLVQRFRGTGEGCFVLHQDSRFMDMPQGNIGKSRDRQGIFVKGQVGGVTAVG